MSKEYEIDFINCTEDECLHFSNKVNEDEIDNDKIMSTFDYFKSRKYTKKEAIKLIKNVVLISHLVNYYRTDFITYCGRLLLTVAEYVNDYGSSNFNILYALCMSQFNEDCTNFKDSARFEIINEIEERFKWLVNDEIEDAKDLRDTYERLLKINERCYHYLC